VVVLVVEHDDRPTRRKVEIRATDEDRRWSRERSGNRGKRGHGEA
jgi:hypothetical protein